MRRRTKSRNKTKEEDDDNDDAAAEWVRVAKRCAARSGNSSAKQKGSPNDNDKRQRIVFKL